MHGRKRVTTNVWGFNLSLPSDLYQRLQVGKASNQDYITGQGCKSCESLRKESNQKQAIHYGTGSL